MSAEGGPLKGLWILEIAEGIAGPVCGLQFADLGAAVFKLEPPAGDRAREWGPPMVGDDAAIFAHLNRGKKSAVVDLREASGRDALTALLPRFDAVVVHMDPDERESCGIDWEAVSARFPRLVVCEIADVGFAGPLADRAGSELVVQAMSGFPRYVGELNGPPCRVGYEIASVACGMHAYQGLLAALLWRNRTGEGQVVRICTLGQLLSLKTILYAAHSAPDAWQGFHLNGPQWKPDIGWQTRDGQVTFDFRHGERDGWAAFCARVGLGHLPDDPQYRDWRSSIYIGDRKDDLGEVYRPVFARMTCAEASALINELGGISVKFHDYAEILAHEQIRALDPLDRVPDSPPGGETQVGTPFALVGAEPSREHAPAPRLNAHRGELFAACGLAGLQPASA
ncbi:MAG: CoA transferase [Proteobacteria bacterium]|nr:CoA transferase [Pseudomonadota bacterium]